MNTLASTSSLVPFDFEGRQIRVFTDEQGEPWFVAADVCHVLGIGNPRKAMTRLDDDEKGVISTDTPGGLQPVATVNEPGLYTLVLGSRKPEAKRFKRWVTHEVRPAIRRTGSYAVPGLGIAPAALPSDKQDSVGALLLIGQAIAQVPGVKPGIAMAATLTCIQENTGLATDTLRRALPAAEEAHLFAQRHGARAAAWHEGQRHEPAPRSLRDADPQPAGGVGAHQCRTAMGRGSALLPRRS